MRRDKRRFGGGGGSRGVSDLLKAQGVCGQDTTSRRSACRRRTCGGISPRNREEEVERQRREGRLLFLSLCPTLGRYIFKNLEILLYVPTPPPPLRVAAIIAKQGSVVADARLTTTETTTSYRRTTTATTPLTRTMCLLSTCCCLPQPLLSCRCRPRQKQTDSVSCRELSYLLLIVAAVNNIIRMLYEASSSSSLTAVALLSYYYIQSKKFNETISSRYD